MDVFTIDAEGNTTQVGTQALFPVILEQACEQFFAHIDRLTRWYGDFLFFVAEHDLSLQEDHGGGEG